MLAERSLVAVARTKQPKHVRPLNPVRWATNLEKDQKSNLGIATVTVSATILAVVLAPVFRSTPPWWFISVFIVVIVVGFGLIVAARQLDSMPDVEKPTIDKSKSKKKGAQKKKARTRAKTAVRIPRDEHPVVAYAQGTSIPVAGTVKSSSIEGESNMPVVSTLPGAVDYRSTLSRLSARLSALGEVPPVPQYVAPGAVFGWQICVLDWLDEAQAILTSAVDLAIVRESNTYPSVRLTRATSRAETALKWIGDLAARKGESSDNDQLPIRCEE